MGFPKKPMAFFFILLVEVIAEYSALTSTRKWRVDELSLMGNYED